VQAEIVNTVIRSAAEAFTKELHVDLQRQSFEKKSAVIASLPLAIAIGLTGDLRGNIILAMCNDMSYAVARRMLPRALPATIKKFVSSAVGELANVIVGLMVTKLSAEQGLEVEIRPPLVFSERYMDLDFVALGKTECLCITFISDIGMLEINIATNLKEARVKLLVKDKVQRGF